MDSILTTNSVVNNLEEEKKIEEKTIEPAQELDTLNYAFLNNIKYKLNDINKKFSFLNDPKKLKFNNIDYSQLLASEVGEFFNEYKMVLNNVNDIKKKIDEIHNYVDDIENPNQKNKKTRRLFGFF